MFALFACPPLAPALIAQLNVVWSQLSLLFPYLPVTDTTFFDSTHAHGPTQRTHHVGVRDVADGTARRLLCQLVEHSVADLSNGAEHLGSPTIAAARERWHPRSLGEAVVLTLDPASCLSLRQAAHIGTLRPLGTVPMDDPPLPFAFTPAQFAATDSVGCQRGRPLSIIGVSPTASTRWGRLARFGRSAMAPTITLSSARRAISEAATYAILTAALPGAVVCGRRDAVRPGGARCRGKTGCDLVVGKWVGSPVEGQHGALAGGGGYLLAGASFQVGGPRWSWLMQGKTTS
jgi:hypothetical protein